MSEFMDYLQLGSKMVFVQKNVPSGKNKTPFLFFNPLFDEKKRSQRFYAQLARLLCENGFPVYRFDYYGTGDSEGALYDFRLHEVSGHLSDLKEFIISDYSNCNVNLLGLRFGADLALMLQDVFRDMLREVFLIEPVTNGKRYLLEQRSRRKIFHRLNKMQDIKGIIEINGSKYEDHQGYPIHFDNIKFIEELNSLEAGIKHQEISIFKLNNIISKKSTDKLHNKLKEYNDVNYLQINCNDFWSELRPVNTGPLSVEILHHILGKA